MIRIKKYWVPGDYILILFIFILAGFIQFILGLNFSQGETAIVSVDGIEVKRLSLKSVQEITVQGTIGTVQIQTDGQTVWLHGSPCPYKICEKMGKIHRSGEMIVCVPNRVVVRILPAEKSDLDATTM